jgi:hypothetical protein
MHVRGMSPLSRKACGNYELILWLPRQWLILCVIALAYFPITLHEGTVGLLTMVAGIFGKCLKEAYGFEFGSSRRAKEKDGSRENDAIASLIDKYNHTGG